MGRKRLWVRIVRVPGRLCPDPGHGLGPQGCSRSGWDGGLEGPRGAGPGLQGAPSGLQVHRGLHELRGGAGLPEGSDAAEVSSMLGAGGKFLGWWGAAGKEVGEALPQAVSVRAQGLA